MLLSIAILLLGGLLGGFICKKIKFPPLIGMLLVGILIGPQIGNLLSDSLLSISAEIRKIALIIILLRAGITLDVRDLKKVGRPALLMCFLPATAELLGMVLLAPMVLGVSRLEAAIMGAVVAAVSPAVIVPRMIDLIEKGYGTKQGIPQIILAGASVDDVFVIVLFTAFTGLATGESVSVLSFVNIPVSVILGILIGAGLGILLSIWFQKVHVRDTVKVIIILSVSFLLVVLEDLIPTPVTFASLIAIMFLGVLIKQRDEERAKRLSQRLNKMWVVAEIFLFVLVGASVNISAAAEYGLKALALVFLALVFRVLGVCLCLLGTKLSIKEKLFCMIAYLPKATVQAAIGGLPLAMGLECGSVVLTVSVLAILITAPLGAFGVDLSYQKLLEKESR